MTKLAKKILNTIQQQAIKPRPQWLFRLRDALIWSMLLLWTLLGSLASAMIIDQLRFNDWDLAMRLGGSLLIKSLPYFWIITLILALSTIRISFQKTKHGYRHAWSKIIFICLLLSLIGGIIITRSGWDKQINNQLAKKEVYRFLSCQNQLWHRPQDGLLAGQITNINQTSLQLATPDASTWLVLTNAATVANNLIPLKPGQAIKAVGKITGPQTFQAMEIRPYPTHCGCSQCQCTNCQKSR